MLLELAARLPRRSLVAGEVLIAEGDAGGALFILLDGALRVEKGGAAITAISETGVCVGELSILLDVPATADVVAAEASTVAVVEDAARALADQPELALALAQLLAARVQRMTTYLADLQHQYADHEGGLGMVDVVLGSLMHTSHSRSELGSERDPHPEY
jgi:CRP/FNR family cyclic AMP-dependent transcriptional regulator